MTLCRTTKNILFFLFVAYAGDILYNTLLLPTTVGKLLSILNTSTGVTQQVKTIKKRQVLCLKVTNT